MAGAVRVRDDYTAHDPRRLAKVCTEPRQIRRLLSLAAVYDGMSRTEAAKIGGMDRQMQRDWVHRFYAAGPDGLVDRKGPKRCRRLSEAQMHELAELVETGPDMEVDGGVRWRRIDLRRIIEERFGVACNERTISKRLAAMGFSNMSARPRHPKQDARVIEAFKSLSLA
ncbi:hypothetical protein MNBD_ALPHA09-429 [hydrothermal vent metagenome]|uniref:Winged helix-turn helix domain-containing protein n=1 Tax=hydrothermal vent metagenome TaxID=652676 RepID=A0A3B0T488_9ZZZZ